MRFSADLLEVNERTQRQSRLEDDDRDDETDQRIAVELKGPLREPDNQSRRDDSDVPQRIAQDMKQQCLHVH